MAILAYLDLQLKSVERHWWGGVQKCAVGGGGELHEEFVSAGDRFWDGDTTPAELEEDRVSRGVAVVDSHVVLHLVTLLPHLGT